MPSGQAYNGQHGQPQIPPQLPASQYPQYGNPYTDANANAHYPNQQQNYVQPGAYTQQPAQQPYYAPQPSPQFVSYDGSYEPSPQPQAPPVEFVNPSFLQQTPITTSSYHPLPQTAFQPVPQPISRPESQPVTQPYNQSLSPVLSHQIPQPVAAPPPLIPSAQQLSRIGSMGKSPKIETKRAASQASGMRTESPALSKKRLSVGSVSKSPSVSNASVPVDTLSLLVCVAEDCFSKARASVRDVGKSLQPEVVKEYHKLIATGLGCLEVAMQSNKSWPRLEARIRLRYANILVEETTNYMEAETALMRGISLCERVCHIPVSAPLVRLADLCCLFIASPDGPEILHAVSPGQGPVPTQPKGCVYFDRHAYIRLCNVSAI